MKLGLSLEEANAQSPDAVEEGQKREKSLNEN